MRVEMQQNKLLIIIVGVGGTGGNLLLYLSQLVKSLEERSEIQIVIIDGDLYEEKNQTRQPCSSHDVHENKANVLSKKCNNRFNLNIIAIDNYIDDAQQLHHIVDSYRGYLPILVGAVDNNTARKIFHQFFHERPNIVYMDGGNEDWNGELITAIKKNDIVLSQPKCFYYPAILSDSENHEPVNLSCESAALEDPQYICANLQVMNEILTNFIKIFKLGYIDGEFIKFDKLDNRLTPMISPVVEKDA